MAESMVDDDLWQEFHTVVNMSSAELQTWLATIESGEVAEQFPDQAGGPTSRTVLEVLGKRRTDLTEEDAQTMQSVVEAVRSERGEDLEPEAGNDAWRHRLMALGHDPLKPR